MEGCLKNGEILTKIITAIIDLAPDVNFDCRKEGMTLQAMDSSHVSLIYMLLRSECFEPWKCCKKGCQLGVHLENLMKLLKFMHAKDSVELKYTENGDELDLIFKNYSEERVSQFSLKLMEVSKDDLGIPETIYKSCVMMSSQEFFRICRDSAQVGSSLSIKVSKDQVKFSVFGELGNGTVALRNSTASGEEESETTIDCTEAVEQEFALRYLRDFTKATPLSKVVTLRLTPNAPLMVEYKIDELGYIRYYLAPKIEDE